MPATNTYDSIQSYTLTNSAPDVTFGSIPQTYTDLVLVNLYATVNLNEDAWIRFNSDSGSNYSWTYLLGNGSGSYSGRFNNQTWIAIDGIGTGQSMNAPTQAVCNIMNYSNTTTYKTTLTRDGGLAGSYTGVELRAGLWRSTSAITSITVGCTSGNLASGSTFSLYGVKA